MITITTDFESTTISDFSANTKVPGGPYQFSTLEIDTATWDIKLPINILKGAPAVVQKVRIRFKFFLGEWFLDTRLGVPYFQNILIKNPDPSVISAIFKKVLRTTPGVTAVRTFDATLDRVARRLTVDFLAVLDDGSVAIAQAEPFII